MNETTTFIFYIFIFLISLLNLYYAFNEKRKNGKTKKFYTFFFISFFVLWFILVFRGSNVGADYINVGNAFTRVVNGTYSNSGYAWFNIALQLFCKMIGIFGNTPFVFYLFIGTITIVFLYKMLLEEEHPCFTLFLYLIFCLYLQTFNQSRQSTSFVIILYSLRYIKEKDFKKYLVCILLASIFHESALIFIPFYFLNKIDANPKLYILIFIGTFIGWPLITKLIYLTKYSIYFTTQYNVFGVTTSYFNLIIRFILLVFCLLQKKKINDNKYNFCYHMAFICLLVQCITIKYYFFGRFSTYFYIFYIILLPKCIDSFLEKFDQKRKKLLAISILLVSCLYFFVYYYSASGASGSGYEIYEFIFKEWFN